MGFDATTTLIAGTVELKQVLGSGGFGKVYLGYDRKRKINVAVKVLQKEKIEAFDIKSYVDREIEVMRKIRHPHIVKLLDAFESSSSYNLVMELAPNGELFDKIVNSQRFDEQTARLYFQQLMSAVHYCHGLHIVHRDIKAENLLLGEQNELKLCDWGLSRYTKEGCFTDDHKVLFHSLAGSIDYQAPEVLSGRGYEGSACDMWSCGAILFFMLCGYLPFTDRTDAETKRRILTCQYNRRNRYLSPNAADLIGRLLELDPKTRYTSEDVINHPWFQVDLDMSLFPSMQLESSSSALTTPKSGDFMQRVLSPTLGSEEKGSASFEQLNEIGRAFDACNVDGNGFLNHEEVRDALIKLKNNEPVSEEEVKSFMSNFAQDKDGCISKEAFIIGWTQNQNVGKKYNITSMANLFNYDLEKEYLREIRHAFDSIDVDHTGLITEEDLNRLHLGISKEEIRDFFHTIDPQRHGGGRMSFEEFVNMCTRYDAFKDHPIVRRLRSIKDIFNVTEIGAVNSCVGTGFTVAGTRENISMRIHSAEKALSTQFEDSVTGTLYGTYMESNKKVIEVGIRLLPCMSKYTRVIPYRIAGKTTVFHQWFLNLRKVLREEILRYEEDTMVKGPPELV
ncbi:protein kinase [Trypanosoma theileri]|uniref:Protein kinase n=1 Tax=Trypanosoma theileri TaxID=67003 RepID=A0A1X0P150_9TRYP|nr:protein kinase [Trypanosoma theileri]ORC90657.1 protein kinase [Trypanosoma theileri]